MAESMSQSKNIRFRKPKLSPTERGHQMDAWVHDRYVLTRLICTRPEIFSGVKFCADSTNVLWMRLQPEVPRVYTYAKRSHAHVKDLQRNYSCRSTVGYGN